MHPFLGVLRLGEGERVFGSYGAMVALGVFVAGGLAIRAAQRARLDVGAAFAALAITVGGGFFGAWLTFLLVEWARTGSPLPAMFGGGFVFFGAVPGGALGMLLAGRWLNLDVLRVLDLSTPGIAAGHALGRMGCLLGGCCFGRPFSSPWAITYTHAFAPGAHPSIPRHATPLYEAVGLLGIGLLMALLPVRRPGSGARTALYLAGYCLLRLGVEAFRGDSIRGVWLPHLGGWSTSQGVALVGLLVAAGLAWRARDAVMKSAD